jgi:hypothetical protein
MTGIGVSLIESGMWIRLCGNTFPCLVGSEILKIALFSFLSKSFKISSKDAFCILKMTCNLSSRRHQERP